MFETFSIFNIKAVFIMRFYAIVLCGLMMRCNYILRVYCKKPSVILSRNHASQDTVHFSLWNFSEISFLWMRCVPVSIYWARITFILCLRQKCGSTSAASDSVYRVHFDRNPSCLSVFFSRQTFSFGKILQTRVLCKAFLPYPGCINQGHGSLIQIIS